MTWKDFRDRFYTPSRCTVCGSRHLSIVYAWRHIKRKHPYYAQAVERWRAAQALKSNP